MALPQMQTTPEVLDTLHVDEQTLHDLVTSGQLPAYDFGDEGLRFKETDVEALARASYVSMFDPCALA